jgi:glycolate oxidase iron-sulfur subunit
MQTSLPESLLQTPAGREADAILRKCVHCGFCNATCPTYQLLGNELDGPRGRIYLIKQMLEGNPVTPATQQHLDRCLTCRACETTCPSGVQYGRLADIGRAHAEAHVPRGKRARLVRLALVKLLPRRELVAALVALGRVARPLLPQRLRRMLPPSSAALPATVSGKAVISRRMLMLQGCVQPSLAPSINHAARRVLRVLGIDAIEITEAGCCGALAQHLAVADDALQAARRNIDAWWPHIEAGAEAIVVTASGCGTMVKEYGHLLRDDRVYADRAARVSALARDLIEVIDAGPLQRLRLARPQPIAFHAPCSLQHGQRLGGRTEALLTGLGFELTAVREGHLCCGSAGSYSILQPSIAGQLRERKLGNLLQGRPTLIATANIGCLHFLAETAPVPVRHWIELIADRLPP